MLISFQYVLTCVRSNSVHLLWIVPISICVYITNDDLFVYILTVTIATKWS